MVHYLRFLKVPRLGVDSSKACVVRFVVTITTDLGESFYPAEATIKAILLTEEAGTVLSTAEKSWQPGTHNVPFEIPCRASTSSLCVRVCARLDAVEFLGIGIGRIPTIMDVQSADFSVRRPISEARVVRRLELGPHGSLRIWEDAGESIARHIW